MQQQLERTLDQFTTGIVNLPILFYEDGRPIKTYNESKKRIDYVIEKDMRYPYFEYDHLNQMHVKKIMNHYQDFNIPYYMHRTMRGWHFLSTMKLHKDKYAEWLKPIHKYNERCPMVTLRVKANKWIGESGYWTIGGVYIPENTQDYLKHTYALRSLKDMIEHQAIGLISTQYYLVHYKMTGELGNL